MARLTNGRVVIEVNDEKASHYALFLGYKIMEDPKDPKQPEDPKKPDPDIPEPRKPRGRPRKAS